MIPFLKSIFLPPLIGSYYTVSRTIVGLDIHDTLLTATKVFIKGKRKTILGCYQEPLGQDTTKTHDELMQAALKRILAQCGSYDELHACIPNNQVIFKEVTVPFLDLYKIKMVIPFEVEPTLPFALNESFIDGIITQQNTSEHTSTVLVAAVKQSVIAQIVQNLTAIGASASRLSVHLFEFFAVFSEIPEYASSATTLVIELSSKTAQFLCIAQDNILRNHRMIQRGYTNEKFLNDIQFTIDTFNNTLPAEQRIHKIIVSSDTTEIKNLLASINEATELPTEEFLLYKIVHNNTIKASNTIQLAPLFTASLGAALHFPLTSSVNFLQHEFQPSYTKQLTQQLATAGLLFSSILIAIIVHTHNIRAKFKKEIQASTQEVRQKIVNELKLPPTLKNQPLESLLNSAGQKVQRDEEVWFALSSQNRYSFLNYLQELSQKINPKALGLTLTQLSLSDATDTMLLEGEVRDYAALQLLEQDLNNIRMFKEFTRPQEPKFSIKITLDKTFREEA